MLSARAIVACLALLLAVPPTASATFPGKNGDIYVTRDEFNRWIAVGRMKTVAPRTGQIRGEVAICSKDPHVAETGSPFDCTSNGAVSVSPDGRSGAALTQEAIFPRAPGAPHLLESLRRIDLKGGQAPPLAVADPFITVDLVTTAPFPDYTRVRWSPDGERLLLDRPATAEGGHAVYVAPASDPNSRTFVTNGSQADWSSTGRIVVVLRGNLRVGRVGTPFKRITLRGGTQPSWSPDGRWIAFVRKGRLFRIRASGGKARRIGSGKGQSPAWSPDGRQVAFFRMLNGSDGPEAFLHVIRLRDGRVRRLGVEADGHWNSMGGPLDEVFPPEWQALARP